MNDGANEHGHTRNTNTFFETHLIFTKRILLGEKKKKTKKKKKIIISSRGRSSWSAHRVFEDAKYGLTSIELKKKRDLNENKDQDLTSIFPRDVMRYKYTLYIRYRVTSIFNRKPLPISLQQFLIFLHLFFFLFVNPNLIPSFSSFFFFIKNKNATACGAIEYSLGAAQFPLDASAF